MHIGIKPLQFVSGVSTGCPDKLKRSAGTTVNILSIEISQAIRFVVVDTFLLCVEFRMVVNFKKQNLCKPC